MITISQQDAGRNPLSPQGYLLLSDQRLIVPSGRSLPAAFDRETGKELYQRNINWRTTAGGVVGGTKAVLADGQIYSSGPHHFLALDEKTGAVGYAWIDGRQLVISDTRAFVADGQQIIGLDRQTHAAATIERQKLRLALNDLKMCKRPCQPMRKRNRARTGAQEVAAVVDVDAPAEGEIATVISAPVARSAARWSVLRSSRTLPGHACRRNAARASVPRRLSPNDAVKCSASGRMSSGRSASSRNSNLESCPAPVVESSRNVPARIVAEVGIGRADRPNLDLNLATRTQPFEPTVSARTKSFIWPASERLRQSRRGTASARRPPRTCPRAPWSPRCRRRPRHRTFSVLPPEWRSTTTSEMPLAP